MLDIPKAWKHYTPSMSITSSLLKKSAWDDACSWGVVVVLYSFLCVDSKEGIYSRRGGIPHSSSLQQSKQARYFFKKKAYSMQHKHLQGPQKSPQVYTLIAAFDESDGDD